MMRHVRLLACVVASLVSAGVQAADDWQPMVFVSGTMGSEAGRLCASATGLRRPSDIGCPSYAPSLTTAGDVSVTGNLSAGKFLGDGSLLTGVGSGDRITSGSLSMIAISNTGYVSLTTGSTTWGYLSALLSYLPSVFATSVSATNVSTSVVDFGPTDFVSVAGGDGNMILSGTTVVSASGAGTIGFAPGGTTRMLLTNSGLTVSGIVTATYFEGDGSRLTGISGGGATDYIQSTGTTAKVLAMLGGTVSFTTGSVAGTAYLDTSGRFVTPGVSVTTMNGVSSTNGYFTGNVGIGTATPDTKFTVDAGGSGNNYSSFAVGNSGNTLLLSHFITQTGASAGTRSAISQIQGIVGSTDTSNYQGALAFLTTTSAGSPSEKMRITAAGNVGIGTATPTVPLHIQTTGTGNKTGLIVGRNTGSTNETLNIVWNQADLTGDLASIAAIPTNAVAGDLAISTRTSSALSEAVRIMGSGSVGIGTTSPTAKLMVSGQGSGSSTLDLDNSTGNYFVRFMRGGAAVGDIYKNSSGPLQFNTYATGSTNATFNFAGGNVGIGTTSPNAKLDVAGTVRMGHGTAAGYQWTEASDDTNLKVGYYTDATTLFKDNIIVLQYDGKVGIGTPTPATTLEVSNTGSNGSNLRIYGATSIGLRLDTNATNANARNWTITSNNQAYGDFNIMQGNTLGGASDAGTSRLYISNAGKIGVGTTGPNYKLHVAAAESTDANSTITNAGFGVGESSAETHGIYLRLRGNSAGIGGGTYENQIIGYGGSGSALYTNTGYLALGTGSTDRLHIDASGNVIIGGTSVLAQGLVNIPFNGFGNQGLNFNDTGGNTSANYMFFQAAGSTVGSIARSGASAVVYNTTSDRRLKENITPTARGLDVLANISVNDFNFISDPHKQRVQGFIAQDLYKSYPEAVTVGGDEPKKKPWAVDYGRVTPLLVKGIQELKAANDNQASEITELKAQNAALLQRLDKLEQRLGK